jgi:membrane associated rhomboid family serine protease
MFAIVFATSLILLGLPSLSGVLMASARNIPSAFTAVFVHKDLVHLGANLLLTLAVLLLYSLSNMISGKKSDNFLVLAIWIATVSATLAFVNLAPNARVGGSSGLVSAFMSGAVVTACLNAWVEPVPRNKAFQLVIGTLLVCAFAVLNLNVDPETNVAVHLSAFFYMAVLMLAKRFLSSFLSR